MPRRHCHDDKYGAYDTLQEAKYACTLDINCSGMYDYDCRGWPFYLCPKYSIYPLANVRKHRSCVYVKGSGNYRDYIFKILVSICL